jgi:hypothetical protein
MSMHNLSFRLLAPMSHGDPAMGADTGNFSGLRKQYVVGVGDVPILSGNAIRGVMRRLVMRHFLAAAEMSAESYGDAPGHWDRIYAALANGGTLVGSEKAVNTAGLRALRAACPPLSVLGAALYTYMLPGMISVFDAYPQCRELHAVGFCAASDVSLSDLYGDRNHARHISPEVDKVAAEITPMPFSHEILFPGAVLETRVRIDPATTQIERDCVAWMLAAIVQLGGGGGRGFGLVEIQAPDDIGDATRYAAWVAGHAKAARPALESAIPARIAKS